MRRRLAPGIVLILAVTLILVAATRHRGSEPTPIPSGVAHHAVLGPPRLLPPGLLGINGEAIIGPGVWSNSGFLRAVATLHPEAIRVFGGTPANFWNWRAGTYFRSARMPSGLSALRDHIRVTLADWARIVRATGATPVFDLNMLTSDLRSQLEMLRAASKLGLPISHVELGNELYLPPYAYRFRNGAAYGRVATIWIAAIKRTFPGVLVAADAYSGRDTNNSTPNRRERRWNAGLLSTLRGESALSLHAYFTSGLGPQATLDSPAVAETMLRAPDHRWAALASLIARLPAKDAVWLTEWNLFDTVARVHATWAQGLADAAFGLDVLSAPRVVQSDYETLVNSEPFGAVFGNTAGLRLSTRGGGGPVTFRPVLAHTPATPLFGLATGGVAMRALLHALAGAVVLRTLTFPSAPIKGIAVAGKLGLGAVIVNLSTKPFVLSVPPILRGLPYTERSAPPITLVAGTASLRTETGTTHASYELRPFSLLRIGKAP